MKSFPGIALACLLTWVTLLVGCVTPSTPVIQRSPDLLAPSTQKSAPSQGAEVASSSATTDSHGIRPRITAGSGRVINERAASEAPPNLDSTGEATFNFEGESLNAVVKAILGDLLQQNYVIAPNVQGTVTLGTPRPVNAAQALSLLEMVLGWNNARLIWSDGRYNVVPADQAVAGNLSPRTGSPKDARGYEVRAVPLKYISASEMEKLLKPYARNGAVLQVDSSRNLIVIAGTRVELQNYLRTIDIFDVDWLAGMSVGVFTLQSAEAGKVVDALEKTFGDDGKTPLSGMFRFMPLEGQNAVMVITPQAKYLKDIESWIERMDAGGDGARLYVYDVQFVKAADLAEQLGNVYGASSTSTTSSAPSLMPGLEPVQVRTTDMPPATFVGNANTSANTNTGNGTSTTAATGGGASTSINVGGGEVGISAVEESNALLIRASPAQWESIRRAIERLDTMPLQVHIEAQVVEVKLTGALNYGVSWFFGNAIDATTQTITNGLTHWRNDSTAAGNQTDITSGAALSSQFIFLGPSAQAVIDLLDQVSDLRVLSAPSLLVRNNVEATFSAGTQIPVASTILNTTSTTNTDNTFSQVQFRQTGIEMTVKPRISSNGIVFVDITQEVSSPSVGGVVVGGNVSVDNRSVHTEVAVQSGETIILAGLIKTEQEKGSSGIPYLSRIPVVGALFGSQSHTDNRSEVLVMITPTIIRDTTEARRWSDEYGERFQALEPLRKQKAAEQKAANKSAAEQNVPQK